MTLTQTTREALASRMTITLNEYDTVNYRRDIARRAKGKSSQYNIHANRLYLEALARAMESLTFEGVTVEMALSENFEGHLLKTLLKEYACMLVVA